MMTVGPDSLSRTVFREITGYMLPIFGTQLIWKYFSILGPITRMGQNGSLALAGAALGRHSRFSLKYYLYFQALHLKFPPIYYSNSSDNNSQSPGTCPQ